ncbi:MAG: lysophospholipid acyltransferase family protein [Chloroflexota bacterium]
MIYWLHRAGSLLSAVLPRGVAYRLVELLAGPALMFYRPHYRNAVRNMVQLLGPGAGDNEARRLVDRVFKNYGKYMADLLRLPRVPLGQIHRSIVTYGVESVDQGLVHGRGLIMVSAHIGNWDLAAAALASLGYPVNAIVDTLQPARWNDEVQTIRRRLGITAIPIEAGVKEMLRCLRRNEVLCIMIDRPLNGDGVTVRFFDTETQVPAGAATLALRTGASIVPAVVVREGDYYIAHVGQVIGIESTGDRARDVQTLTQRFMSQFEAWIRMYPDQWFMFRDMWPTLAAPRSP